MTCNDLSVGCDSVTMPKTHARCSNVSCGYWGTDEWESVSLFLVPDPNLH